MTTDRTDDDLLALLCEGDHDLPRDVIDEVARRGAAWIPRLVDVLESDLWDDDPPAMWAPLHATFALHAMGLPATVEPLLVALQRAHETEFDWVFNVAGRLFDRVGPDCAERLRLAYLDPKQPPLLRWNCLDALANLGFQRPELHTTLIRDAADLLRKRLDPNLGEALHHMLAAFHQRGHAQAVLDALSASADALPDWLADPEHPPAPDETLEDVFGCEDPLSFYDPDTIARRRAYLEE